MSDSDQQTDLALLGITRSAWLEADAIQEEMVRLWAQALMEEQEEEEVEEKVAPMRERITQLITSALDALRQLESKDTEHGILETARRNVKAVELWAEYPDGCAKLNYRRRRRQRIDFGRWKQT